MRVCPTCHTTTPAWPCAQCGAQPQQRDGYQVLMDAENAPKASYDVNHFAGLAAIEEGYFWFEGRNAIILQAIARYIPAFGNFMELGCGTGFVLAAIAKAYPQVQLSAGDYFGEALAFAHRRVPDACLYQLDAHDLPFEAEFDVMGAFDVIEHIAADEVVLAQMAKATRPGGYLLLTVPHHKSLWTNTDVSMGHERRYTRDELRTKVERAGFEVLYTTAFVALLSPAIFAARYARQVSNMPVTAAEDVKISPAINAILRRVMALETALLGRGVRFSIGGSRLLIAQKPADQPA